MTLSLTFNEKLFAESTVVNKYCKHYKIPHNNLLEILSILEDALNIHNTLLN